MTARSQLVASGEDDTLLRRVAEAAALTLELDDLLDTVRELVVPGLADFVGVHLPTAKGLAPYLPPYRAPEPPNPHLAGLGRRLATEEAMPFDTEIPAVRAFVTGASVIVPEIQVLPQVDEVVRVRARGAGSGAVVPLRVGGDVLGTFALARRTGRPVMTDGEVELAQRVAARIAVAVAHAQRYDRERRVASTLQQVLLPAGLPCLPGVGLAARYLSGVGDIAVGGDWYDVLPLPRDRVGLFIGDVMGRGVRAAALMGQLRAAVRAYARLDLTPARTLELLDELVLDLEESAIVTAAYLVLDRAAGELTYARAGHLPPLLMDAGRTRWLAELGAPPLGTGGRQAQTIVPLPPGAVVMLFTDGLVEDRRTDLDLGLDALARAAAGGPPGPDDLADHLLHALGRDQGWDDDIALLIACVT